MTSYSYDLTIQAPPAKVFRAYVERINEWWPWKGANFTYSFAPEGKTSKEIHFEPKLGGRYYERFADGSEYEIGRITHYDPPHKISFTWKGPDWPGDSLIEITFEPAGDLTRLSLTHSGFEIFDDSDSTIEGYNEGSLEIMGHFTAWLQEHLDHV